MPPPARREVIRDLAWGLGATYVADTQDDLLAAARNGTGGTVPSTIYEGTGVQAGLTMAESLIDWETLPGQRIVVIGFHQTEDGSRAVNEARLDVAGATTVRAHWRKRNAQIMPSMRAVVSLMRTGHLPVEGLLSHTFGVDQAQPAFELGASRPGDYNKIVLRLN